MSPTHKLTEDFETPTRSAISITEAPSSRRNRRAVSRSRVFTLENVAKRMEGGSSARPGSNRCQEIGSLRCYHYTTGAKLNSVAGVDPYSWALHWDVLLALAALTALYYASQRRWPSDIIRRAAFDLALILLLAVYVTPLHTIAMHYLLSVHFLQNVV